MTKSSNSIATRAVSLVSSEA